MSAPISLKKIGAIAFAPKFWCIVFGDASTFLVQWMDFLQTGLWWHMPNVHQDTGIMNRGQALFQCSKHWCEITHSWNLKPWLDRRLFSAILGDCVRWQRRQSGAISGDLQRDVSTFLTNEKGTRSPSDTRRFLQYFEQIADDHRPLPVFTGENPYSAVIW